MRALLLLLALSVARAGAGAITDARLLDQDRTVALTVHGQVLQFEAEAEHFWNFLITSGDREKAFALREHGDRHAWDHDAVYEFSPADYARAPQTYKPRRIEMTGSAPASRPPSAKVDRDGVTIRLGSDPKVVEIYAVSADGSTLLVSIRFGLKGDTGTEMPLSSPHFSYREQPWFMDTRTGKVSPVTP